MLKIYQATHVGKVRKNNEDALAIIKPAAFVVADGMGGAVAGEVASNLLIDTVQNFLLQVQEDWTEEILKQAILKSNTAILQRARENPELQGMGTTATILNLSEGRAYFAQVGDSRLYRMCNLKFEQITEDQSYVESLVRSGEITPEQARVHPMKNVLTQAVGAMEEIEVEVGSFEVQNGDIYLLCTDGLTNMVDDWHIGHIILESENPADDLIQAALDGGGHDNISVIVVKN